MGSVSWVTVVWSMIASASLTLSSIYALAWFRNRAARAHLLFSLTALSLSGFAVCEFWMMRAATAAELLAVLKWAQLPLFGVLISMTWFVAAYLRAGRVWLAWLITGIRGAFLLVSILGTQNVNLRAVEQLRQIPFLGETVTVPMGAPNPLMLFGQFGALLILIFVADASVTVWRRGEHRKALLVGGSVEFFLLTALANGVAVLWGYLEAPFVFSVLVLGLVAVMAYELSSEVLRASQLVRQLQASETGLRENQVILEARNHQISDLFGRLIAAQETERARVARDLHDDVSQRIAALSMMISSAKRKCASADRELLQNLSAMQHGVATLAEEIRHFSHDLHPMVVTHSGLVTRLREFCAEFARAAAIKVTFTADPDVPVDAETSLCLYRIAQEGLRNVAKHAGARHVSVTLQSMSNGVQLSIVDDGQGFALAGPRAARTGLGLVSMDERARLLRGRVRIDARPQHGTTVIVEIPAAQIYDEPATASQSRTT